MKGNKKKVAKWVIIGTIALAAIGSISDDSDSATPSTSQITNEPGTSANPADDTASYDESTYIARASDTSESEIMATSTPEPTVTPTPEPTATPTPEPMATSTPDPTATPASDPTATPAPEPTPTPNPEPASTSAAQSETLVWVDDSAKRYHRKNGCGMDNAYQVPLEEAIAMGKTPCGRCYK